MMEQLLQYRSSDGKFVTRTEIVTTTGTLTCLIVVTFKDKKWQL